MSQLSQNDDKTAVDWQQDADHTVISSPPPADPPTDPPTAPEEPKKRGPWLWIIIAAVIVLLCVIGAGIGGVAIMGEQLGISLSGTKAAEATLSPSVEAVETEEIVEPTATQEEVEAPPTPTDVPTDTPEPTPTEKEAPPTPEPEPSDTPAPDESDDDATPTTDQAAEPTIGSIVFAADADGAEPIDPGSTFSEDLDEIHAFFSFEGLEDGLDWERVWYQNGEVVASGTGSWEKGESGDYHLSLSAGGEPLGAGNWQLEIYVDGKIVQSARFTIEGDGSSADTDGDATPESTEEGDDETPTRQAAASRDYKLAFSRWDGGKHDMYIVNTDGTEEQFLFQRAAGPSWSPDGDYLTFFGEQGVDRQVINGVEYQQEGISDGILYLNVTTWTPDITKVEVDQFVKDGSARWAAWSPSGDMVAYDGAHGGETRRIYFLGTGDNRQFDIEILGEQAGWSPDSNKMVYRSGRDNKQGIWISNRDDSGAVAVTADGSDAFPRWSPDGRRIAFHREAAGNVDIYTMNVDGSNIRRLTEAPGPDTLPTWTPDGRIVFRSARSGSWGIYIMNADSSGQTQIVANADPGPDWAFGRMDVR